MNETGSEEQKINSKRICVFAAITLLLPAQLSIAQNTPDSLYSASVSKKFFEIAYELTSPRRANLPPQVADNQDPNITKINQALVFLKAAAELDQQTPSIFPYTLELACSYPHIEDPNTNQVFPLDHTRLIYQLLTAYSSESADFHLLKKAVDYLLQQLNSRQEREKLLKSITQNAGTENKRLDSYLAAKLGNFALEKTDVNSAAGYYAYAYDKYKYNHRAFYNLAEIIPDQIEPSMYLKQSRLRITENPLDFDAAMNFARNAEKLHLHKIAADAYQYCSDLYKYLYPSRPTPSYIYLPLALNYYNTEGSRHKVLQIAEKIRETQGFDLILESIAAKAAEKVAPEKAGRILKNAEEKTLKIIEQSPRELPLHAKKLAWFYCFANPELQEAIDWANKAFSFEPNSVTAASLLAYALTENGQTKWAATIIENYQKNQISDLVLAKIELQEQNTKQGIDFLRSAIARDPASLEAQIAKNILQQQGGQHVEPLDPQMTINTLQDDLQYSLSPEFTAPNEIITAQLNTRGSDFSYTDDFQANLNITNNSTEPLVISDNSLFKGYIRVDASIRGSLSEEIPNLISKRVLPSSPIQPGKNLLIPLKLDTKQLKEILTVHPQASLSIHFTAFLDPVNTPEGKTTNSISNLSPAEVTVKRSALNLNAEFLRNRLEALSKGRQGQKIQTANLFIGLLAEQRELANKKTPYKLMYSDWMPELLKSAIEHNLKDENWVVKTNTMAQSLYIPLNYRMTKAVAANLNHDNWPARLMAMYLLAEKQNKNFSKVLDWFLKNDSSIHVRNMALALGAEQKNSQYSAQSGNLINSKSTENQKIF